MSGASRHIPWWQPSLGPAEKDFLVSVLESNFPNEGELTRRFERKVCELLGCRHAVAVTSCTAALSLALLAIGVGRGDEVIVPDITFIATANAVHLTGATPVLVDVDPSRLTIDVAAMEAAISPRTRAVIPVHVSGRAADMHALLEIAKRHGLHVVEDAAEALMSRYHGRMLGTVGVAGCFSFSPAKTITTGQGGLVVTDDDDLHGRLRELKDQGRPVRGTGGDDVHVSIGYNFKFTDLQAAVGLGQLEYLERRVQRMRRTHQLYRDNLKELDGLHLLPFDLDSGELPQWTDALIEERDPLDRFLREADIDCRRYWHPIHRQAPYLQSDDRFPQSTVLSPKALWLPSAFTLTDEDVERVCERIRDYFARA